MLDELGRGTCERPSSGGRPAAAIHRQLVQYCRRKPAKYDLPGAEYCATTGSA